MHTRVLNKTSTSNVRGNLPLGRKYLTKALLPLNAGLFYTVERGPAGTAVKESRKSYPVTKGLTCSLTDHKVSPHNPFPHGRPHCSNLPHDKCLVASQSRSLHRSLAPQGLP